MSLDKIVSKVEADSKAAEHEIIQEAERQAREAVAAALSRGRDIMAEFKARAEQTVAQLRSREEAGLEMEQRKLSLGSRRRTLDMAFEHALRHLENLPADTKKQLYSAMVRRAASDIPTGTIRCRKDERPLFEGIRGFSVGEPIACSGGFILVSQDRSMEVDMRFEVLLRDIWDRSLSDISAILFGDGK